MSPCRGPGLRKMARTASLKWPSPFLIRSQGRGQSDRKRKKETRERERQRENVERIPDVEAEETVVERNEDW